MKHGKPQKQAVAIAMNVKRRMAKGGQVSGQEYREPELDLHPLGNEDEHYADCYPGEDNHSQPDAMNIAREIMHRKQVDKEKHNESEQNYARGGVVQGTMSGRAGEDGSSERVQGRGDNEQSDGPMMGTDVDDDEEYDGIHTDSDQMPDDLLSYDDKPSLHDKSVNDNEEFDSEYKTDRKFAKGGMVRNRLKKLLG